MQQIKNIIFDLGGVILNVDYFKTAAAFTKLGFQHFDDLYSQHTANELFTRLETGNISEDDFYTEVQKYSKRELTPDMLKIAWNAMLLDFRVESLEFLDAIKGEYNTFLLSNTNSIHHTAFGEILTKETGRTSLDDCFKKSYYSHIIQKRKPNRETYEFVLADSNLKPEETLFIDDSIYNISGAMEAGLHTHFLEPGQRIEYLML